MEEHNSLPQVTIEHIPLKTEVRHSTTSPKVIKQFSCSAQLRLNLSCSSMLNILSFISKINYRRRRSKRKLSISLGHFGIYEQFKFYAQLIQHEYISITSRPGH